MAYTLKEVIERVRGAGTNAYMVFHVTSNVSNEQRFAGRDQHAIVIGAGPAGSLAAMALAKQGFKVDVFEKRPEPKLDHVSLNSSDCHPLYTICQESCQIKFHNGPTRSTLSRSLFLSASLPFCRLT